MITHNDPPDASDLTPVPLSPELLEAVSHALVCLTDLFAITAVLRLTSVSSPSYTLALKTYGLVCRRVRTSTRWALAASLADVPTPPTPADNWIPFRDLLNPTALIRDAVPACREAIRVRLDLHSLDKDNRPV